MTKKPGNSKRGGTGTPATVALTAAGIEFTVHSYEHDPGQRAFGAEAAAALQINPAWVFKTLIVDVDELSTVAVLPVNATLDLKAHAARCGGRKAALADQVVAERITGYVVGGISPIGQKRKLKTVLDDSALTLDTLYVSGGKRGMDIGLSPKDLMLITDAVSGSIARFS
ncbi:MAG: Cys-tRNA(Pro) deacylase [Candidatus Nanopelagicales bacterium]|nr:Cys-tRNA(Pro) deacylase [Candidatus Nanopelagicales bacterium]